MAKRKKYYTVNAFQHLLNDENAKKYDIYHITRNYDGTIQEIYACQDVSKYCITHIERVWVSSYQNYYYQVSQMHKRLDDTARNLIFKAKWNKCPQKEQIIKQKKQELYKRAQGWGATLDKNGKPVEYKNGFQVSYEDGPQTESLEQALEAVLNGFNGIWYDSGIWYIDKSMHIVNEQKARKFGIKNNQKSILNWLDKSYIWLN